jgi:hypothetical protein
VPALFVLLHQDWRCVPLRGGPPRLILCTCICSWQHRVVFCLELGNWEGSRSCSHPGRLGSLVLSTCESTGLHTPHHHIPFYSAIYPIKRYRRKGIRLLELRVPGSSPLNTLVVLARPRLINNPDSVHIELSGHWHPFCRTTSPSWRRSQITPVRCP